MLENTPGECQDEPPRVNVLIVRIAKIATTNDGSKSSKGSNTRNIGNINNAHKIKHIQQEGCQTGFEVEYTGLAN